MKRSVFLTILILLLLPLIVLPLLSPSESTALGDGSFACGRISIPERGIWAEFMTADMPVCDCCPALWNGGVATTAADLSSVQVWDVADLRTLDGGHLVLECVEILPCIRVGRWLIGWRGIIRTEGDVLLVSGNSVYRFMRM